MGISARTGRIAPLLNSTNNWDNIPSIQGFATIDGAHGEDTDPRTLTGDSDDFDIATNVFKSPSKYNVNNHEGLAEFQDFGIVALGGGSEAKAPNLVMFLDTTGVTSPIKLNFDANDLDSSGHDAEMQLNVQYRVGETGPWTNVLNGYFEDVTSKNATPTTHVSVELPADAMNQPQLQIRIVTTDSQGVTNGSASTISS